MDLRNLTDEEFLLLAEEESKAPIKIGRRPHPSAFPSEDTLHVIELPAVGCGAAPPAQSRLHAKQKAS